MGEHREYKRQIVPFKDYFKNFKRTLGKDVLMKIYQVFIYIMSEDMIPTKFLKSIEGTTNLYEIRVEHNGNIYRIFCCFDEGNLVILFNAFQKKSQKTPSSEIKRALRMNISLQRQLVVLIKNLLSKESYDTRRNESYWM